MLPICILYDLAIERQIRRALPLPHCRLPFSYKLHEIWENKGKRFDLAVTGNIVKLLDWGCGLHVTVIKFFFSGGFKFLLCQMKGLETEWQVQGKCPSALCPCCLWQPLLLLHSISWSPGQKASSMQHCSRNCSQPLKQGSEKLGGKWPCRPPLALKFCDA